MRRPCAALFPPRRGSGSRHRSATPRFPQPLGSSDGIARAEADYASALALIPDGAAKAQGIALGQAAAAAVIARRADDGSNTPLVDPDFPQGSSPGEWRFTPGSPPIAFATGWGQVQPFALRRAAQFRPGPPLAVDCEAKSTHHKQGCREYAADVEEVQRLGGEGVSAPSARSAEQTEIALFWVESSPLAWNRIARSVSARQGLDLWQNARLFGLLNMALADGYVASFDTKYHYRFWRPVTAIREAADDGNPDTRGTLLAVAIVAPVLLAVWVIAWQYSGRWWPAAPLAVLGETLKYSMLGAFVYGARSVQRHADHLHQRAVALDASRREFERQAVEARLQLLQAQIEPHFLFNTLANVRRLYRKHPTAGAEAIDNLMTYLRAALPQVRRTESTLGEEFELARAYLQLFQVRMGPRLRFTLDLPPALRQLAFAPMVLVTLAENAIKHGLAPADLGGTVTLRARRTGAQLEVCVADDGVGFGPETGGNGVGLVNIRRQLAARFGDGASLVLEQQAGGGVVARLLMPCDTPSLDAGARRSATTGLA